jgi:hypothetical protein
MENNIKINNLNNTMDNLIFSTKTLSSLDNIFKAQELVKDIRTSIKTKDGLSTKVNSISAYDKQTSEYVQNNQFNSNVYYNLAKNDTKTIEVTKETNSLNIKNENNENINKTNEDKGSFLIYFNLNNQECATEGLFNLPKTILNKFIKTIYKFEPELAANQSIVYKFNDSLNYSKKNLYTTLVSSFNPTYALISQPHIVESINRVDITLFFYSYVLSSKNLKKSTASFLKTNEERLKYLCENLSQLFKTYVNLDLIRLYNPSSDSNILANAIGSVSNKTKIRIVRRKLLKRSKIVNPSKIVNKAENYYNSLFETKNISPGNLSGLNVKVAGRLLTEKVVPRRTVRSFQIGSLARGKANIVKTDRYTRKNKRGCFSVTVKTGHIVS